ncbi:lysylphosphatidylglycerol synthase transmembrane domain-containing protein [Halocalculus aciditolerans]|uniref:TIGR00374 family protein n=1 Tax=Halocalculus aciditolerans TaxID=1383812 RepID=A0A830F8A2_9EURY|nr:lysylphosphatidylglycerol synthase transmembrane domain-containing protein [Halocalculus aciditolerans]GGL50089.1 TIGR00374 family protein [Halocalculus aciditolerans]
MDFDTRGIALGFVGAAAVLAVLVWYVGVGDLTAAFRMLSATSLALILLAGLAWLAAWGMALRRVLAALGIDASITDGFLLYAAAAFANNVTPFGQAGGEPFSALLISRATNSEYERGLAAIASVDSLNFVPSIVIALIGLTYYIATVAVGNNVLLVLGVVVGLAVLVPTVGYLAWRFRTRLQHAIAGAITPVVTTLARVVPSMDTVKPPAIRDRVASFFTSIERVATSRRDIAISLGFSAVGWLCMCLALYLSLRALAPDSAFPGFVVLVVVPVATIASITPLPGGAGGVEFAIVLLLVPTTGIDAATASAAAIVYRGATYWSPTIIGGLCAALLQGRTHR